MTSLVPGLPSEARILALSPVGAGKRLNYMNCQATKLEIDEKKWIWYMTELDIVVPCVQYFSSLSKLSSG